MKKKERVDALLVQKEWAETLEKARRMILAGQVHAENRRLDKPGEQIETQTALYVKGLSGPFVSRGGLKLQAAFQTFASLSPCPEVCADIGASTGGFTDCLVQKGAKKVYAVDTGRGQIALKLREDSRVILLENTNARYLTASHIPEPLDLVVSDVSFISLRQALPAALQFLRPESGQLVALVKPQFEAAKENVEKGGVVRDSAVHQAILEDILLDFLPGRGLSAQGLILSPLRGPAGNREYLLLAGRKPGAESIGMAEIAAVVS